MNGGFLDPEKHVLVLSARLSDVTLTSEGERVMIRVENLMEGIEVVNPTAPVVWRPV